ncbi:MAG: hypothetical protein ACE5HQ_08695 [Gemmatimonadota bacterium]
MSPDGSTLAPGVRLDDPAVIARFDALLDRLVPLLVRHGGFYLGVGNEVDERFREFPSELEPYLAFVAAVRAHAHTVEPGLAVGATMTRGAVLEGGVVFTRLRAITDAVPFTFYDVDPASFFVTDAARALADLDRTIARYGNGPVIIQELGCPSSAAMNSSAELQRACFQAYFDALPRYPQVRFVSVFTLQDLDGATCDAVVSFFGFGDEGLPPDVVARLRGFVCEVGLVAADGAPKPAWDVFLNAVGGG